MRTKVWFSAKELAGLPGMPRDAKTVRQRAEKEGWRSRPRTGRGGGVEYRPTLPPETTAHLDALALAGTLVETAEARLGSAEAARLALRAEFDQRASQACSEHGLKQSIGLAERAQQRMDRRLEILQAWERLKGKHGLGVDAADKRFVDAYNEGDATLGISTRTREAEGRLSDRTLRAWRKMMRERGIVGLAGAYGNRKGTSKIDRQEPLRKFVQAMLVTHPHSRAPQVMQAVKTRMAGDVELPSMRSLERWIEQWRRENKELLTAIANPDGWKNSYMVAFGSYSDGIDRPNQKWELDSTPADVMLTDGRHSIIGVIDVNPRRLKLLVSKTSKATAVAALIRRALLDWGVPETAKTDNGSDYTSKHITRVFSALEVKQELCEPFSPWQKPHIERAFGTFARSLMELLPNFIGHNVAERSEIRARQSFADRLMKRGEVLDISMSSEEFQEFCDRWCDDVYAHNPHEGLKGRTPFEVLNSYRGRLRTIADERALDILLAEAPGGDGGFVTVQKKGVRVGGAWFIAPELEGYVGQRVRALYDGMEHDLGRLFIFGGPEMQFICLAECPERTGLDRREVAIKAKELQKKRVQEQRRALKEAAKKVGVDDIAQEILRDRARAAGKLTALPRPTDAHESAGLTAAADAAAEATRERGSAADLLQNDRVRAIWERQRQQAQAEADAEGIGQGTDNELARRRSAGGFVTPDFESKHQRAQWMVKQERIRVLTGEEREFLATYKKDHPASYQMIVEIVDNIFAHQKKEDPAATGSI